MAAAIQSVQSVSSNPVDTVLNRLDKVRQVRKGRWMALCPAHDDKSPSLQITEGDRGVLIKCWYGCEPEAVISALGLTWSDLFPRDPLASKGKRPDRAMQFYREILKELHSEAMLLMFAANDIVEGRKLSQVDLDRVIAARQKIEKYLEAAQ